LLRRRVGGGDVEGDVGRQRRLAHRRSSGQDDQVGGLQPAQAAVDVAKPGRYARKIAVAHIGGVGHVNRGLDRVGEGLETAIVAPGFGKLEQAAFGVLDLVGGRHVDRCVEGDVDHVLADRDQRPARG
jgi:hypothetical protein